jgi:hypothetical protein
MGVLPDRIELFRSGDLTEISCFFDSIISAMYQPEEHRPSCKCILAKRLVADPLAATADEALHKKRPGMIRTFNCSKIVSDDRRPIAAEQ